MSFILLTVLTNFGNVKISRCTDSSISRSAVYQNWWYVRRMYHISYSKYEDTWSVPLTIFPWKKKETRRCQNNRKILEKMSLKIMEKLQKKSKSCKNRTCFFDYTNVSLMTILLQEHQDWEGELQLHTLV
jgi:hypothetical protein